MASALRTTPACMRSWIVQNPPPSPLREEPRMLDFAAVLHKANEDFEFTREIRYYTGRVHVTIGERAWEAEYNDGHFVSVGEAHTEPNDAALAISGSIEHWEAMTQQY